MSLNTFVKVANVSNLSDARYCAGMGVDVIGFNVDPTSDEQVSSEDFKEITEWIAGVQYAGEFSNADLEQIKEVLKNYPLDYIEISSIKLVEKVQLLGKPIIVKLTIDTQEQLDELKGHLSYLDELAKLVVVKSYNPAHFDQLDEKIAFYNGNLRLLKGYGIDANEQLQKFPGVELEATKEEKPGFKDYGEVMDVLEALEE